MMWRLRRSGSPELLAACDRLAARSDTARVDRLAEEMADTLRTDPVSAAKYLDYKYWIPFNMARAASVGLHKSPPLKMLDIGCGPGYFLSAATELGHDAYGVDVPPSFFTETERRVYAELLPAFGNANRVSPLLIERYVPLPFEDSSFDLITAFWICFNRHRQPDEWGVDEWRYFLNDARRVLRPGGRIVLEPNEHRERYGELRFCDASTRQLFESAGVIEGNFVIIPAEEAVRR